MKSEWDWMLFDNVQSYVSSHMPCVAKDMAEPSTELKKMSNIIDDEKDEKKEMYIDNVLAKERINSLFDRIEEKDAQMKVMEEAIVRLFIAMRNGSELSLQLKNYARALELDFEGVFDFWPE
jgi:hypothetical protein